MPNVLKRDAKALRDQSRCHPACVKTPNLSDLFLCKFRIRILSSVHRSVPALGMAIPLVVEVGSEPQVRRAKTDWAITGMTNEQTAWDRSVRDCPCQAMNLLPAVQQAVPVRVSSAGPVQASISIWDVFQEVEKKFMPRKAIVKLAIKRSIESIRSPKSATASPLYCPILCVI